MLITNGRAIVKVNSTDLKYAEYLVSFERFRVRSLTLLQVNEFSIFLGLLNKYGNIFHKRKKTWMLQSIESEWLAIAIKKFILLII